MICFSFRAFRSARRCLVLRGSVSGSGKRRRGLVPAGGRGRPPLQRGDGFWHPRRGRCPHRPVAEAFINHRLAAATAQPLAALPLTDAACPLRASGTCGKRSWSNTFLHLDALRTIRHGTAVPTSQKTQACPKVRQNRRLHRYADPRRAEGNCTGARPSGLFFWTVHGPFSFRQDRKENGGCIPHGPCPLREQGSSLR